MSFEKDKNNRSFSAEIFLIIMAFWIGSYAYYQMFLSYKFKPLYSYLLIIFFTCFWVITQRILYPARLEPIDQGLKSIGVWMGLYTLWTSITYLYSSQSSIATESLIVALEGAALFTCFVLLVNHSVRVIELATVLAILALAGSAMCLWDFIELTFSTVTGRGAGFYSNPTIAGDIIALTMVGGFLLVPNRLKWSYIAFCGLGVLVTFSRASWLSWGVAVIGLSILRYADGERRLRWMIILSITAFIVLLLLALFSGVTEGIINKLNLQQYMTMDTFSRLGIGKASLENFSASSRWDIAKFSINMIREAPFFGYGIGYTKEWAMIETHNMYLQQWLEGGFIQLALYIGLLVLMWKMASCLGKIMLVQIALNSLFTHNNLEHPAVLLLFAFIIGTRLVASKPSTQRQVDMQSSDNQLPTATI
ncbi:hypothetical protein BJAS_P2810 [Bathymodiolus japonicus methanotrophic gill symbiont]|uniref:O-antigen ligase family protein n=1 Tax=Bathymodiolus japonicus methanotrophic gill symbiont TaxID=113269 RepID=UPI001B7BCCE3|nr:O-antigen ligase family protein [Bathymodiolus japonicus methanotrophic gill symbiont]GFO72507.1 hypothetical protein BJAS_P2810 [Bathymodiolus japonicus methanotrophic gill symbiont]